MPQQQVAYVMAPQPVTYAVPEGAYTVPEGEMMTAPGTEMPAVTYVSAQPQMIYAAPPTGLSYEGAPAGAVMLGGTEYATPGTSYTYLDYDNAYFPDEAPIAAVTTEAETVAPVAAATIKTAEKISKKKSKKTKVSSKKKGCC